MKVYLVQQTRVRLLVIIYNQHFFIYWKTITAGLCKLEFLTECQLYTAVLIMSHHNSRPLWTGPLLLLVWSEHPLTPVWQSAPGGKTLTSLNWRILNAELTDSNWTINYEKKVMQKHVMNCNKMVNHGCMLVYVLFWKSYILIWLKDILEGQKLII